MSKNCNLTDLKDLHSKEDIYIIGSGNSLSYIDKSFFENKTVICINYTILYMNKAQSLYLVAKEPSEHMQTAAKQKKAKIVTCKHHSGVDKNPINTIFFPEITYLFEPGSNVIEDKNNIKYLERSSSTIVTGIHLAAFMGCKNIILVGHDCGYLDGEVHVTDYYKKDSVTKIDKYKKWMSTNNVEAKTFKAKQALKKQYNINVYSLNPFINFNLEGHTYKAFKGFGK